MTFPMVTGPMLQPVGHLLAGGKGVGHGFEKSRCPQGVQADFSRLDHRQGRQPGLRKRPRAKRLPPLSTREQVATA